jgi:hypothetical protein
MKAPGKDTPKKGRPFAIAPKDSLCLFLHKARIGTPYYPLSVEIDESEGATHWSVIIARNTFNKTVGRRLFHLQHARTVRQHLPEDWPQRFHNTLLIGDGYPKAIKKSGTFVLQRITWSSYKHDNIVHLVLCMCESCFVWLFSID